MRYVRYVLYRTDVKYIRIMHIGEVKKSHRKALFMLSAGNVISLYVGSIWVVSG